MGDQRFAWDGPRTIEQRLQSAVAAVRARFGAYIAEGPTIYAGFSQGATLAGPVLLGPAPFPAVVLAEGGYNLLRDGRFLRQWVAAGSSRLLVVCGSAACFLTARGAAPAIARQGLALRITGDPLAGHNLNQRMQAALQQAWPDFVLGLPNWAGFRASTSVRRDP
jgi:predicted esterase